MSWVEREGRVVQNRRGASASEISRAMKAQRVMTMERRAQGPER